MGFVVWFFVGLKKMLWMLCEEFGNDLRCMINIFGVGNLIKMKICCWKKKGLFVIFGVKLIDKIVVIWLLKI